MSITGSNINNLSYADDTTLRAESKEELQSLLMMVKEESEKWKLKKWKVKVKVKSWLKTQHSKNKDHGIWSHHFRASGPITSWHIGEKTMETVTDFIFLGPKITADADYSCKIRRRLLFERKAMTNTRQHIEKQRHYFANKAPSNQSYGFFQWSCMDVRVGL